MKNKTIKSKFAILMSAICSGALLIASGLSAAWFYTENNIDIEEGLTGSVLQKYFHDGDGSEENPFIITRPRHYENMVLLHYNLEGFAEKEFYFEIGTDLDGAPGVEVYNYKDGKVDTSEGNGYSQVLNCDRIASLAPLGSLKKPFNAHIQGNNITVSGFEIDATRDKFCDIGVFGFVGHGTCLNTYFSDFVIDTTGTEYEEPTTEELENGTGHAHQKGAVHFGYLAGHLDTTENFQNVYVNNCTIKGNTNGVHVNNYGYYGRAEQDALGGGLGIGRDYKFSLNSQAVYNYFSTTYDSIKDQQLVLRNTAETYNIEADEEGDKIKRMTTDGQHIVPFSNAVSPDSAAGSGTYLINDGYSLSTSGYANPEFLETKHEYNVYYQDREYQEEDGDDHSHNGEYKTPEIQPVHSDHSLKGSGEGLIVNTETGQEAPTPYFYYDDTDGSYVYGESYDRKVINGYDVYDFDLKIKDFSIELPETKVTTLKDSDVKVEARLYWDDDGYQFDSNPSSIVNNYEAIPMTATVAVASSTFWGLFKTYKINLSAGTMKRENIQEGWHNYSILISIQYPYNNSNHRVTYVFGNYDSTNNILDQNRILVNDSLNGIVLDTQNDFTKTDRSATSWPNYTALINPQNQKITRNAFVFNPNELIPHVDARTFESKLYYKDVIDGVEVGDYVTVNGLTEDTYSSYLYTPRFGDKGPTWILIIVTRDVIDNPEEKEYFAADSTLVKESGYRSKNIDVVGGGAEFYYQTILGNEIAVLSLTSEAESGELCRMPPEIGSPFFPHQTCKSSIVIYLKNTSNAIDGRNDELGKISFTYVQASILGMAIETVEPCFKKGDSFMSLKKAGTNIVESSDSGLLNLTHNIALDLTEDDVQKVSYCALDEDGKVLGRYESDGSTTMSKEDQIKIDTYVLVLGGQSDNGYDTWITNIDFDYKAVDGFGGSFGSVGYRDATDTIENTVFNFFIENPVSGGNYLDFAYSINVKYTKNEAGSEKTGTYYITCYADAEVSLKIFNYYSSEYDVYVKSTPSGGFEQFSGSSGSVSIPISDSSSW